MDDETQADDVEYPDELYKQWFKVGGKQGFLSLKPWVEKGKVSIDIGEIVDKKVSNTMVWANMLDLAVYLRAVANGTAAKLFPRSDKAGVPTPEGYTYYGGSTVKGQDISRILKIHHWQTGEDSYDSNAFVWKTAHFKGKRGPTGAFMPQDMSNPLSFNLIRVTRLQMAQMQLRMELTLIGRAATVKDWWSFDKKDKEE